METKEEMEINEENEVVTLTRKEFDEMWGVNNVEENPERIIRKARLSEFGRILRAEYKFARSRGIPYATFGTARLWDPENHRGKRIKGEIMTLTEYRIVG